MSSSGKGTAFLDQFKEFIFFLHSLWGILAGISVLFPLSNELAGLIPLRNIREDPPGALEYFSPGLVTTVCSIVTLFVVQVTFGQRERFRSSERSTLQRRAWLSFGLGLLAFLLYFAVYVGIYRFLYEPLDITAGDPRRLVGDVLLLTFYSAFFAFVTKAFMLLGMVEFFGPLSPPSRAHFEPILNYEGVTNSGGFISTGGFDGDLFMFLLIGIRNRQLNVETIANQVIASVEFHHAGGDRFHVQKAKWLRRIPSLAIVDSVCIPMNVTEQLIFFGETRNKERYVLLDEPNRRKLQPGRWDVEMTIAADNCKPLVLKGGFNIFSDDRIEHDNPYLQPAQT